MAEPESDRDDGRVKPLEHHDKVIEVFLDIHRRRRTMKTATKELVRLTGLTEDVAYLLAKEMTKTLIQDSTIGLTDYANYPRNIIPGRIAAGLKVPYNIATSYGEPNVKDDPEKERD